MLRNPKNVIKKSKRCCQEIQTKIVQKFKKKNSTNPKMSVEKSKKFHWQIPKFTQQIKKYQQQR